MVQLDPMKMIGALTLDQIYIKKLNWNCESTWLFIF
jgi:hypothetical protein